MQDPHPDLKIPAPPRPFNGGSNDFKVVGAIDNGNEFDVATGKSSPMWANANALDTYDED